MCSPAQGLGQADKKLTLTDVIRAHADRLPPLLPYQQQAIQAIVNCRTSALGGHLAQCNRCGHPEISYNSCRHRACPRCQTLDKVRWVEAQQRWLLPVEYHHVVFTVPGELHPFFRRDPRAAIGLLFGAVAQTLKEVAANPKNLGARIGFSAVLHTWTQKLQTHPHIHCLVPGGGLSPDGERWISCKPGFFLPVGILSTVFRGKLLSKMERAVRSGTLNAEGMDFKALLRKASGKRWVVYSKPPVSGPEQTLEYLGRYTHKSALSNSRLVSMEGDQVTFTWRDRSDGNRKKLLTLEAGEFLRRFVLHIPPRGLVRLRHYGLLSNVSRKTRVPQCRELLGAGLKSNEPEMGEPESWQALLLRLTGKDVTRCPKCEKGQMVRREPIPKDRQKWGLPSTAKPP